MKLLGYKRPDGSYGIRNYVAVIPTVLCANHVAKCIARQVQDAVALPHPLGCGQHGADLDQTVSTLIGLGRNPNIGAVLIVGLGCERITVEELSNGIAKSGKPVEKIKIQDLGGTLKTIEKGVEIAGRFAQRLSAERKAEFDLKHLIVGLKCGGTDATSGIAANPALGVASNRVIKEGGSAILTEVGELVGAEHILAKRAVNDKVAQSILDIIRHAEDVLRESTKNYDRTSTRAALVTPGNFDGGVSSVAEKALGGMFKSGTAPFAGTLKYAEKPATQGLFLMDAEGQDGEVVTSMVAGGAQVVVFTTGRGTPTGFPFVPVIKVTGNSLTYQKMQENIDINAGTIIEGKKKISEVGDEIFNEIVKVASGKKTKAELLQHDELFTIGRYETY